MDYLTSLISEWMPERGQRVAVDSHPRLSGIMDTVNSTLAHGPRTRLPTTFYDQRGREIMDRITMEEWFSGYNESREYRELGVGSLIGDIVARMVNNSETTLNGGRTQVGSEVNHLETGGDGGKNIKLALSGCHDSTLGAILSSLGAFQGEKWPPYTSHLSIELFRQESVSKQPERGEVVDHERVTGSTGRPPSPSPDDSSLGTHNMASRGNARRDNDNLLPGRKQNFDGLYVRVRYNDRPIVIPGCKLPGKHLRGNESFCTLVRVSMK
jgi:acid phosphatase